MAFPFNNLPRELRVMVWNRVPLESTRHEIRTQQGRVQLVTQGVDNLRLVCRQWNADVQRYVMYRAPNVRYRGPTVTSRIPRMKIQGAPWDLLAAQNNNNRWQGIVIAAMDWFATLKNFYHAAIWPLFTNWLSTANRLGPLVGALPLRHRNAIVKWVYQTGFILATDMLRIQPTDPEYNPADDTFLVMAFMYNIRVLSPNYLDPENVFYPRLQDFAHELRMVTENALTATIDDDPAVLREFTFCDPANAQLRANDEDVFVDNQDAPDLAWWRDLVFLEVPPPNAAPSAHSHRFVVGHTSRESDRVEDWEGSVEEYVKGWGVPI